MVHRERRLALIFSLLILTASFGAMVPTAQATHPGGHVRITLALEVAKGGVLPFVRANSNTLLIPGDLIRLEATAIFGGCSLVQGDVGNQVVEQRAVVNVNVPNLGDAPSLPVTLSVQHENTGSDTDTTPSLEVKVKSSGFDHSDVVLQSTTTATCHYTLADSAPNQKTMTVDSEGATTPVKVDNVRPTFAAVQPLPIAGPSQLSGFGTNAMGAGAKIPLNIPVNFPSGIIDGAGIKSIEIDASEFGWGAGFVKIPVAPIVMDIPLNNSAQSNGEIAGVEKKVWFRITDNSDLVTLAHFAYGPVDNVLPKSPITQPRVEMVRDSGATTIPLTFRWTPPTEPAPANAPHAQLLINGLPQSALAMTQPHTVSLTGIANPLTQAVTFSLRPVDPVGNLNVSLPGAEVPLPGISNVVFGPNGDMAARMRSNQLSSVSFAIPQNAPDPVAPGVRVLVERLTAEGDYIAGFLRNDRTGASPADWVAAAGASTQFAPTAVSTVAGVPNVQVVFRPGEPLALPPGSYALHVVVERADGNKLTQKMRFVVDGQPPSITAPALMDLTKQTHLVDGNPVQVRLTTTDGGTVSTGVRNVTVELVHPTSHQVAHTSMGALARTDYTAAHCGPLSGLAPVSGTPCLTGSAPSFDGWVNASFPGMPPGDYRVRVVVGDHVGNTTGHVFDAPADLYKVGLRLAVDVSGEWPIANQTRIFATGLGAMDLLPGQVPAGTICDSAQPTVCPLPKVTFQVKNVDEAETAWRTLGEIVSVGDKMPQDSNRVIWEGANTGVRSMRFFNYSPPDGFLIPTMDKTKPIQLRLKASATVNGVTVDSLSPIVQVATPSTPALALLAPASDWRVNTTGLVNYSVKYEPKGLGTPEMSYTLHRNVPGVGRQELPKVGPLAHTVAPGNTAFFFNGSFLHNGVADLPEGEYTAVINLSIGGVVRTSVERNFVVAAKTDATKPKIFLEADQPSPRMVKRDGFPNQHVVNQTFEVSLRVEHGMLNLTSENDIRLDLIRANPRDNQGSQLNKPQAGFDYVIKNHSGFSPHRDVTWFNVSVKLPDNALDGDAFSLGINATTDGAWSPTSPPITEADRYKATLRMVLRLDTLPPGGAVLRQETNATGNSNELRVTGFAEDGSGIQRVDVRIYDVTKDRTLLWLDGMTPGSNFYAEGDYNGPGAFATSDLVKMGDGRYLRNVGITSLLQNGAVSRALWSVNQTNRPVLDDKGVPLSPPQFAPPIQGLNNESLYRVDVRVVDRLGRVSEISSGQVRFDHVAPTLVLTPAPHGIGWNGDAQKRVDWHGTPMDARIFVNASDNNCVTRVLLHGFGPAGNRIGPAELRPVDPKVGACGGPRNQMATWTASFRDMPHMTDVIGTHRYWIEVIDASGLNATSPLTADGMLAVHVQDNHPPEVHYANLEPSTAAVGTTSRVVAGVFENYAISQVTAIVYRMGSGGSLTEVARGPMKAGSDVTATGSGTYSIETADLGVKLEIGEYFIVVRANDTVPTCVNNCQFKSAILKVTADAGPSVASADASQGAWVNATPTLRYRVSGANLTTSAIAVSAGNSTENLTSVNVTYVPLPSVGGVGTGYVVTWKPTTRIEEGDLVVRVRATSSLTNTTTFAYKVDASPPTANHTVAGAIELGGRRWATSSTRVVLNATDEGPSGLASLRYSVNGGDPLTYAGPITPSIQGGAWTLEYTARDNASNAFTDRVTLHVDKNGPTIVVSRHGDDLSILVTEPAAGVGIDEGNVTVHYAYNGSATFLQQKLTKVAGTANAFQARLPGNASSQGLRYWFEAKDLLGNTGTLHSAAAPHQVEKDGPTNLNLPPTVRITAPAQGQPVRGAVELKWVADDPEGDRLTFSVGLQGPGLPSGGRFLLTDAADVSSHRLDMSNYSAGSYTFTVVATDGKAASEVASRSFVVEAGRTVRALTLPPAVVPLDSEATFAVEIQPVGKNVTRAIYRLVKDGEVEATGPLTKEGTYYAGTISPQEPGTYQLEVVVAYDDRTEDKPVQVASFQVPAPTAAPSFPVSLMALLAFAVLAVALAAFGAFGRWR